MLRITMVEDNPADSRLMVSALEQCGLPVNVVVFNTGAKALDYLLGTTPVRCDLVLLDLNLPGISGYDVLERIRQSRVCATLPVVAVSGSRDPLDVDRCYREGANSYVCKTTHLDDIFTVAAQLVTYWSSCATLPTPGVAPSRLYLRAGR
jgi:CheY-like chemotaxis protein